MAKQTPTPKPKHVEAYRDGDGLNDWLQPPIADKSQKKPTKGGIIINDGVNP
jgi:hypothetical protein